MQASALLPMLLETSFNSRLEIIASHGFITWNEPCVDVIWNEPGVEWVS